MYKFFYAKRFIYTDIMQIYMISIGIFLFCIQYVYKFCLLSKKKKITLYIKLLKIEIPYEYLQLSIIAKFPYFYTYSFQLWKQNHAEFHFLSVHTSFSIKSHRINRLLIKSFNWIASRISKHLVKLNQESQNCIG